MCPPLRLSPVGVLASIEHARRERQQFLVNYGLEVRPWRPGRKAAVIGELSWDEFKQWWAERYGPIGDE